MDRGAWQSMEATVHGVAKSWSWGCQYAVSIAARKVGRFSSLVAWPLDSTVVLTSPLHVGHP